MASFMTQTSPHCVHWNIPDLPMVLVFSCQDRISLEILSWPDGLICQLQKYLQMIYLADGLTARLGDDGFRNKSPEAWAREWLLLALYLQLLIWNKEVAEKDDEEEEGKKQPQKTKPGDTCYREMALKRSQREANLCHPNNFQMFSSELLGVSGELPHLMTLLPRAAVIVISWEVSSKGTLPFPGVHLVLLPLPHVAENRTFDWRCQHHLFSIFTSYREKLMPQIWNSTWVILVALLKWNLNLNPRG